MSDFQVGGQAVIEGVMIRSETHVATAVRRADKTILVKCKPYVPLSKRVKAVFMAGSAWIRCSLRNDGHRYLLAQFLRRNRRTGY